MRRQAEAAVAVEVDREGRVAGGRARGMMVGRGESDVESWWAATSVGGGPKLNPVTRSASVVSEVEAEEAVAVEAEALVPSTTARG